MTADSTSPENTPPPRPERLPLITLSTILNEPFLESEESNSRSIKTPPPNLLALLFKMLY